MRVFALRAIPIMGWLFLAYGAIAAGRGKPLRHRALRTAWWIDAFLSIVVHTVQIPVAIRRRDELEYSRARTAALTLVFGLTWWKTQPSATSRTTEEIR